MVGRRGIVVFLVVSATLVSGVAPAVANSCANWNAQSIVQQDGTTWVLQSGSSDGAATVYRYASNETLEETHDLGGRLPLDEFDVTSQYGIRFTGIAPARSSGWWALTESGTVVRYDEDWHPMESIVSIDGWSNYDLARTPDGWVVLDRDGLRHFDERWQNGTRVEGSQETGFPTLGLYTEGSNVWLADSARSFGTGGTVHRFTLRDSDGWPRLSKQGEIGFDWEVQRTYDITRATDGGWLVLEDDGELSSYTGYWQFTGHRHTVTNAIGYCGFTFGPLALVIWGGLIWLLSMSAMVGFSWWSSDDRVVGISLLTTAASWAIAILYGFFLIPEPFSLLYQIPDVIAAFLLAFMSIGTVQYLHECGEYETVTLSPGRWFHAASDHRSRMIGLAVPVSLMHSPSVVLAIMLL